MNFLVVEDNEDVANTHSTALKVAAQVHKTKCHIVVASEADQATNFLKVMPAFDAVICDLNLGTMDNSRGAEVARWIKSNHYPARTYVSSAKYQDNDPTFIDALPYFDGVMKKDEIDHDTIVQRSFETRISKLKKSTLSVSLDPAKTRSKTLQHLSTMKDPTLHVEEADYLRQEYRVIAVQPTFNEFVVACPFLVWMKDLDEGVYLEVFGQPRLFSFGTNLSESLDVLHDIMLSMFEDFINNDDGNLKESNPVFHLREFLMRVYDGNSID